MDEKMAKALRKIGMTVFTINFELPCGVLLDENKSESATCDKPSAAVAGRPDLREVGCWKILPMCPDCLYRELDFPGWTVKLENRHGQPAVSLGTGPGYNTVCHTCGATSACTGIEDSKLEWVLELLHVEGWVLQQEYEGQLHWKCRKCRSSPGAADSDD